MTFDFNKCIAKRPFYLGQQKSCQIDAKQYQKSMFVIDLAIKEIKSQSPEIQYYDPRPLFCNIEACEVMEGNQPLYFDRNHLNKIGADRVIKAMLD